MKRGFMVFVSTVSFVCPALAQGLGETPVERFKTGGNAVACLGLDKAG